MFMSMIMLRCCCKANKRVTFSACTMPGGSHDVVLCSYLHLFGWNVMRGAGAVAVADRWLSICCVPVGHDVGC